MKLAISWECVNISITSLLVSEIPDQTTNVSVMNYIVDMNSGELWVSLSHKNSQWARVTRTIGSIDVSFIISSYLWLVCGGGGGGGGISCQIVGRPRRPLPIRAVLVLITIVSVSVVISAYIILSSGLSNHSLHTWIHSQVKLKYLLIFFWSPWRSVTLTGGQCSQCSPCSAEFIN